GSVGSVTAGSTGFAASGTTGTATGGTPGSAGAISAPVERSTSTAGPPTAQAVACSWRRANASSRPTSSYGPTGSGRANVPLAHWSTPAAPNERSQPTGESTPSSGSAAWTVAYHSSAVVSIESAAGSSPSAAS